MASETVTNASRFYQPLAVVGHKKLTRLEEIAHVVLFSVKVVQASLGLEAVMRQIIANDIYLVDGLRYCRCNS